MLFYVGITSSKAVMLLKQKGLQGIEELGKETMMKRKGRAFRTVEND